VPNQKPDHGCGTDRDTGDGCLVERRRPALPLDDGARG
jgi:hypothetical protein